MGSFNLKNFSFDISDTDGGLAKWLKIILNWLLAKPAMVAYGFVIAFIYFTGVMPGEPFNLTDPNDVARLSYEYPETAAAVGTEFEQDMSGSVVLYISSIKEGDTGD